MIYADNAATQPVKDNVADIVNRYMTENYANASAIYNFAVPPNIAIDSAKIAIADKIGAKSSEIYFTSGGTESDNWAIKGIADALRNKGNHIITTKIEHPAILKSCKFLEERGYDVTYLDVDSDGVIDLHELESEIKPETILISVQAANNEIGTIEPITEIGKIAKKHNVIFHADAVQAFCNIPIDVNVMNIDLMSIAGHKIGASKGVGVLYIRNGVKITPLIHGGSQENGMRAGTYNTPGIAGLCTALVNYPSFNSPMIEKRDKVISGLLEIDGAYLNGGMNRLPNNVNVRFDGVSGETLLYVLESKEIYCSAGSACAAGNHQPSHVLSAIGLTNKEASESIRITISHDTTDDEIDELIETITNVVRRLRGNK